MKKLIKNGYIVDKGSCLNGINDILIEDDKILKIGKINKEIADEVIDAQNCIVIPGLIDHHAHIYPFIKKGIPAETVCFSSGVTTVIDAGSCGCDTYEEAREFLKYTKLTIKSYLNMSSYGLSKLPELENLDPVEFKEEKIRMILQKYPDEIIGLKLRTSKDIVRDFGLEPLKKTIKIAERLNVPVMIHPTDPPEPIENIIKLLRKGDILTHMYQNISYPIINEKGKVYPEILNARRRGVLFEAADARAHFSLEVAERAIENKFVPDIIATDLTAFSMYQRPTSFNLIMQISKYENLGISFDTIISSCTETPAKLLGIYDRSGALKPGYKADIAILRKIYKKNEFGDRPYSNSQRKIKVGDFIYNVMLTLKEGETVYRNNLF